MDGLARSPCGASGWKNSLDFNLQRDQHGEVTGFGSDGPSQDWNPVLDKQGQKETILAAQELLRWVGGGMRQQSRPGGGQEGKLQRTGGS